MTGTYELIYYPTDGEFAFADKSFAGTFANQQEAKAAAGYPEPEAWQESGNALILADDTIESLGRQFSPYLIQPSRARVVGAPADTPSVGAPVDVEREAWKLVLMYAESGIEDDIDEDGEFDEDVYAEIRKRAMQIVHDLRTDKVEREY